MAIKSYNRGHEIYYDDRGNWRYVDTNERVNNLRACARCNCVPTKEGYDACMGYIENAVSVCCGHGVGDSILIKEEK